LSFFGRGLNVAGMHPVEIDDRGLNLFGRHKSAYVPTRGDEAQSRSIAERDARVDCV